MPVDRQGRADSATRKSDRQSDSESAGRESESLSDSDSEADFRPQRASKLHLLCPGCNKAFTDRTKLRQHRAAYRTADPACRNAAKKRPRTVRRDVDAARQRDAEDRLQQMMGDGSHSGLAASDTHSPFLQPSLRDEVLGPGARPGLPPSVTRSRRFTPCLQNVYTRFPSCSLSLYMFAQCLHMFALCLH